jgi:serine/threonine-protein kinase
MHDANLKIEPRLEDSARPGGTILRQQPPNGRELEEGSTVVLTVSRTDALVPDVSTLDVEAAKVELRKRGFLVTPTITPDYRDDVDPGTVMSSNPAAYLRAKKSDALVLVVAADPHVKVPNVVGLDQATATSQLQALGLDVAVQTQSSTSKPVGQVMKSSPNGDATAVRGDTVTLTVSSGPKQVSVPYVVGDDKSDAIGKLEDDGFAVNVVNVAVTSSDQVDQVLAQNPSGGQAADGSTVTITVGVRAKK